MNLTELAKEIIEGRRLNREDDLSFFIDCDLNELCQGADEIRRHFCGEKVDLCTIINGRSGRCGADCKYCAQSAHNHTSCSVYDFMEKEEIAKEALANESEGVDRFAIVTSGRGLSDSDFEKAVEAYQYLKNRCRLSLCASHGFLTAELGIESIPINALMPIPGTPLEGLKTLQEEEILRTIAFFRYINPEANIRLAAGRALMRENGERAFQSGASATITGNMLTTSGSSIAGDKAMLSAMGRDILAEYLK